MHASIVLRDDTEVVVIPSPAQGASLRHLGLLRTDETPMLAAHWLVDYDSPSLRQLAGLSGSEGWLIDQLWSTVLTDLGVEEQSDTQAWDVFATYELATLKAGRPVTEVMNDFVRAYRNNEYPGDQAEASRIWALDDELSGGWGRAPEEVEAEVAGILASWAGRVASD